MAGRELIDAGSTTSGSIPKRANASRSASWAYSLIPTSVLAPATPAACATANTVASGCRTPRGSRGSGTCANTSVNSGRDNSTVREDDMAAWDSREEGECENLHPHDGSPGLEHERSGAVDFEDMGGSWVGVRNSVASRTLRTNDKSAAEVVQRYGQLISFAGMRLSRNLGVDVQPELSRAERQDLVGYLQTGVSLLVGAGILTGALRVPNAVAPVEVTADLRSGLVTCLIKVSAPSQGRSATRVNWLTRQLGKAPNAVMIEAWAAWARAPGPCHSIPDVRKSPNLLLDDPKK